MPFKNYIGTYLYTICFFGLLVITYVSNKNTAIKVIMTSGKHQFVKHKPLTNHSVLNIESMVELTLWFTSFLICIGF